MCLVHCFIFCGLIQNESQTVDANDRVHFSQNCYFLPPHVHTSRVPIFARRISEISGGKLDVGISDAYESAAPVDIIATHVNVTQIITGEHGRG